MTRYLQVSTAAPTREAAVALARSAVGARLAAGAQIIGPATSAYWHQGEFGTGEEWVLLLKTTADRYPALQDHLIEQHPWDNPEVTATVLAEGSPHYLAWVRRTTDAG
jgi:periplasmic divalent cation tolerance protein